MLLKYWLQSDIRNPCVFKFGVFDIGEQYDYNDDVIAFLVISGCLCPWQPSNYRGQVKKAD